MRITREQIKCIQLQSQGLLTPRSQPAKKEDVIQTIRQMELLQIDTIHVVARSPYFVLWSRLGDYDPRWLDETHKEGLLFEYLAHAACFIPIEQYPLFRPQMLAAIPGRKNSDAWRENNLDLINHVIERITVNGQILSADFENTGHKSSGWGDWKKEKQALEYLWARGVLMIAHRKKFQRVYDLAERVHPGYKNHNFNLDETLKERVERSVRVLGASRLQWVWDYYRLSKATTARMVNQLLDEGIIFKIPSADWNEDIYIHKSNAEMLDQALSGQLDPTHTTLLTPFDPLVWHRERTLDLYHFDYKIECYVPAPKRKYGYFSLPILYRGNLVGRLDAKANRQARVFEVRSLHFESGFGLSAEFKREFTQMLQSCADWHTTPEIRFSETIPQEITAPLAANL